MQPPRSATPLWLIAAYCSIARAYCSRLAVRPLRGAASRPPGARGAPLQPRLLPRPRATVSLPTTHTHTSQQHKMMEMVGRRGSIVCGGGAMVGSVGMAETTMLNRHLRLSLRRHKASTPLLSPQLRGTQPSPASTASSYARLVRQTSRAAHSTLTSFDGINPRLYTGDSSHDGLVGRSPPRVDCPG